jgi:4-diphosphocytidyl-2-C-methyl-D-erythritol kinase
MSLAFAKINLSLRVLGVRADGYHELRTIFQSIALHDTLFVRRVRGPFRIVCDDPACPTDSTNLIARAAVAVWKAAGRRGAPRDVIVRLDKQIPVAAGLGGGSSDAAAALRAFARIWQVERACLPDLAASLGADVPYFLVGGTAIGLERGDLVFSLVDYPSSWVTLALPAFGVSTREAFAWFDHDRSGQPANVRSRRAELAVGGIGLVGNDLQVAVAKRHPEITRIVAGLRRAGASHAAMTGSGSAVFGLFDRRSAAARAAEVLGKRERTIVTRTIGRTEYCRLAGK